MVVQDTVEVVGKTDVNGGQARQVTTEKVVIVVVMVSNKLKNALVMII